MKRYFYLIAAIAGLFMAASCQKENFEVAEGDYADVSFTTELPSGVGTKAIADGQTVNKLYYEVYAAEDVNGTVDPDATAVTKGDVTVTAGTASVNVRLVKNKSYTVFFWAQYEGDNYTSPYTWTDLRNISVSYTNAVANDERRDAFYFVEKGVKYSGATTTTVTLTRPFAQVNVGTDDRAEFERDGVTLNGAKTTISVTNVANVFTPFTKIASVDVPTGATELTATFSEASVPTEDLSVVVNNATKTYDYLAMAYVLVPNSTGETTSTSISTISSEITLDGIVEKITVNYEGATVQQNRRTNLVGKLLTTSAGYDIVIDNNFLKPDHTHEYENVETVADANVAFADGKTAIRIESVTEDASLELPKTTETTTVLLPDTDKTVTFTYPEDATAEEKPAVLNITVPEESANNLVLDVPNTTVYVNGNLAKVTASTSDNTLIVTEGTIIENLVIVKGNVRIEKGGKVVNITRSEENTDNTTTVYLGEDVTEPSVDPDDTKIVFVQFTIPDEDKTFAEQIEATTYGKVTLTEDVVLDSPLTITNNQEVIIDLNGYTLSYQTSTWSKYMITNHGKLTIKDSGKDGEIALIMTGDPDTSNGTGNYTIENTGTLTIENGTISAKSSTTTDKTKFKHAMYAINNTGSVIINGGKIYNSNNIALRMVVNSETKVTQLNINGGEIEGLRAIWIQLPGNNQTMAPIANIDIKGGTLTAWAGESDDQGNNYAIYSYSFGDNMKNVTINVFDGTFNGDIALTGGSNKTNIETLNIYGGTFNGFAGDSGDVYSYSNAPNHNPTLAVEKINIKGGTFSSFDVLGYMSKDESATIKLLTDLEVTESITIPTGAKVVLDLNGKTLSQTKNCTTSHEMITNNGKLTITGNGTIRFTDTSAGGGSTWGSYNIQNLGELIVENGTIEHLGSSNWSDRPTNIPIQNYSGKVTINGGVIRSPQFRSLRDFTANGEIIINGGTFEGQVWMQGLGSGSSSLIINGGNFSPTAGYDGSSIYITNGTNEIDVEINGGYFNTKIGSAVPTKTGVSGCIKGGIFTTSAKDNTDASLIATDYEFSENTDGTWTVQPK